MRMFSIILAGTLMLSSCSDVLDVRNEGQLSTEAALSDARSVNVAMSGIYSSLQGSLGSGIPASPTEALAGDIVYAGSDYGYLEIWTQNMSLFTPSFSGFGIIPIEELMPLIMSWFHCLISKT